MNESQLGHSTSHTTKHSHLGREFNPFKEPQLGNPYPFFARARQEEPIFYSEYLQAWVVTRYEDVRTLLMQPDIFSSKDTLRPVVTYTPEVLQVLATGYGSASTMINTDGEEHARFRTPLSRAFLPARLRPMEDIVRTIANRLVDGFFNEGQTDIIAKFADPLPQEIMLTLLGVPQSDMTQCKRWSDDSHALRFSPLPPERQLECAQSSVAFQHYIANLIEERRNNPKNDVISSLLAAHTETGASFTTAEMVWTSLGVLLAGHKTTTNLLGTLVYLLLSQEGCWQHACVHPEDIPLIVEEVLRFGSPFQIARRTAQQEIQVSGVTVPKGALVLLAYGSANHDEAQFPNPEQFMPRRSPNQHLAFGHGIHFCIGAPLARIEGRVTLEVLSHRLTNLRLSPNQTIAYLPNLMFRGLTRLEVVWDISNH